jgi:hypothetical protein
MRASHIALILAVLAIPSVGYAQQTMDLLVDLLAGWWARKALPRRGNHALRLGRHMGHPLKRARLPAPRASSRPAGSVGVGLSWTGCRKMYASHRERTE